MARGTANRTNNNSFRVEISPLTQPHLPVYLNDLHIVASHHELCVVGHEVAGVPGLSCVVPPILGMVWYPTFTLLIESVDTTTVVNLYNVSFNRIIRNIYIIIPTLNFAFSMMRMSISKGKVVLVGSSLFW